MDGLEILKQALLKNYSLGRNRDIPSEQTPIEAASGSAVPQELKTLLESIVTIAKSPEKSENSK